MPAGDAATFDLGRIFDIGKDVKTATTGIDEKDEIAIGREVAGRTLGAAHLVNDRALQTYVNRVGRWVASQSERPDLPWRFGVVDTPSINAFAAPGGYVLITRGLYEILDNESQLAGVLGHEIGHIVRKHHITAMQDSAKLSAGANVAGMLAQRRGQPGFADQFIGTGAEIFARGLDKNAEYEADHLGVVLAARAGYTPNGLIEVLQKLQVRGGSDASLALLFSTHPQPADRLGSLKNAMAPWLSSLPAGSEPDIQPISASAASAPTPVASPARTRAEPETASRLAPEPKQAAEPAERGQSGGGLPIDTGHFLRGLIRR